jgi:AraC family transcriptional regulator
VSDVVCTAGPTDQPFEEQHSLTSLAIVVSGTFLYRSTTGRELMTPGSVLLGNAGDCFCCGHEHATGDRCVSFAYSPEFLDDVSEGETAARFRVSRVPPIRALAPLVAGAVALLSGASNRKAEELSIQLAVQAVRIASGCSANAADATASAIARVTRVIRMIDNDVAAPQDLRSRARLARLSPYHFLRTFEGITGITPHQYLLRQRLRYAAVRLRTDPAKVLDIALECGFGDISNFNRTFRAEFGMSPRAWRNSV